MQLTMAKEELTGQRFGRLTVLGDSGKRKYGKMFWRCNCACGNITEVSSNHLQSGSTQSCGCLRREISTEIGKRTGAMNGKASITHGDTANGKRHPLYKILKDIKARCHNPNSTGYRYWGGRGIKLCKQWQESYEAYKEYALANGWRDGLMIHRIDNDLDYCPGNVTFLGKSEHTRLHNKERGK